MDENRIKEYTLDDGTKVTAYIPQNVSNDTPVFYYSYVVGSDYSKDPVWQGMEEDMARYDGDAIVIVPHDRRLQIGGSNPSSHLYQNNAVEAFNTVKEDLGIETTQFINGGFSAGFGYGTRTLAHYLQENPDADRQVLLAVDGVINPTANLQQSELDALKANGTVIISFTQQKNHKYQANLFKSTGLPILYVVDNSIPEQTPDSKYWGIHDQVAMDFFDKGLYEQVINFALGKGDLNLPDGYSLRYYDPKTGEIVRDITPAMAAELMGITSYTSVSKVTQLHLATLGDIKSNDKTLDGYINDIRKAIRNTNFLMANFNEASQLSTTKIPTAIPELVNSYFGMTASLLNSISNKTVSIAKIAGEIEILDNNLAAKLEDINNGTGVYPIADPLPDIQLKDTTLQESIVDQPVTPEENVPDDKTTPSTPAVVPLGNTPQEEKPNIPSTLPTDNNEPNPPPSGGGGGSDNGNNIQPDTTPENTQPQQPEEVPIEEQFPKYDELLTDDNKIVYNHDDGYKVVVHHEDGKITGIEHYYDFKTTKDAEAAVKELETTYKDVENFDKVIQKDQYVKVLFKDDMYKDLSLDKIKENFKDLEEAKSIKV